MNDRDEFERLIKAQDGAKIDHPYGDNVVIYQLFENGQPYLLGELNGAGIIVQADSMEECIKELLTSCLVIIKYHNKK